MAKIAWVKETELQAQHLTNAFETKIAELKAACNASIFDGFKSASTGHEFGFNELDQANFTQQLLLIVSKGGPAAYQGEIEWKTKAGGVESFTATQFVTIINEAEQHKRDEQRKYWALEIQLKAATTVDEIAAIKW